jgi:tetratricopeptide (TPR) repeat protein
MTSCSHHRYPVELTTADSLAEVQPDSAVALLRTLQPTMVGATEGTKMYYDLLTIKAQDKTYVTHRSDKLIMRLVNYYENGGDEALLPVAYYYAGRTYADMQDVPGALDYFQRALGTMKDRNDATLIGKIYSQMGHLYMDQDLYDNAIEIFQKAYHNSAMMKDTVNTIYDLCDIADACFGKMDNHSSISYLKRAHHLANVQGDISLIIYVESYMSRYYCYIGKYELAKKYIMPSLKDIEPQDTSAVYASVADVYRLSGKEDSASYYFNKIKNIGTIYAKEVAYRFFTRTGIERNGDKKILEDFDIYNSYIDSVRSVTSTEALAKANALYNYQLREVENIRLEKANARMHAIVVIASLVALVLLLLSLALLQYHHHRRIRMQMQIERLKQIKESIYKKSQEYIDGNKRRIEELEHLLETTGQENEGLKTKLQNERSRLISENEIAEIENRESELAYGRIIRTDIFRRFNGPSSSELDKKPTAEDWAELERVVNEEYSDFTNRLMGFCNISSNELRVSLLLKINVSPSRIAILTNHTETSVSATRRRLYEKAFNKKGTPKEWDNVIKRL